MKAKKILDFKSLIEETVKMIRVFVPLAKDIKISIDRLISKEILQRDEKDREMIRYRDWYSLIFISVASIMGI